MSWVFSVCADREGEVDRGTDGTKRNNIYYRKHIHFINADAAGGREGEQPENSLMPPLKCGNKF